MHEQRHAGFPLFRAIVSEQEIQDCVCRLAGEILNQCGDDGPLVLVAVMKGALVFLADLIRHLPVPLEIELLRVASYDGTEQGEVRIASDVSALNVSGRHVLVVDCVLDTGRTLAAVTAALRGRQPLALASCVLLSKRRERVADVDPDYVGMEIPDVFVVGYGLDCADRWRHLPYVAELPTEQA